MMNRAELAELIAFLRENGVTEYRTPEVSLVLGEPPAKPVPELDKPAEVRKARPGADGLTREEQELLYGRAIDGE